MFLVVGTLGPGRGLGKAPGYKSYAMSVLSTKHPSLSDLPICLFTKRRLAHVRLRSLSIRASLFHRSTNLHLYFPANHFQRQANQGIGQSMLCDTGEVYTKVDH